MSGRQDTLFRHLTLLQLIPRAPHYRATTTLQTLLEERGFKVELRTIQRDLEKMSAHFPLLCDRAKRPYRWSFDRAFKSNLPALDTATALTLVLAEEYLRGLLPQIAIDQLAGQFENARKYLDGMGSNGFAHWSQRVKAIPNGKALIPAPIDAEVWQKVTDALLDGQALEVQCMGGSGITGAAISHLAHSTPERVLLHVWDPMNLIETVTTEGAPIVERSRIRVNDRPGLGVSPREDVLGSPVARYR